MSAHKLSTLGAAAPAPPAVVAGTAAPAQKHVRATTYDEAKGEWVWVDGALRRTTPAPNIPAILRDKLAEHGIPRVVEVIGLSRPTVLSLAAEANVLAMTMICAGQRLHGLHLLDAAADECATTTTAAG